MYKYLSLQKDSVHLVLPASQTLVQIVSPSSNFDFSNIKGTPVTPITMPPPPPPVPGDIPPPPPPGLSSKPKVVVNKSNAKGEMLGIIGGFDRTKLKKATTIDKSAPVRTAEIEDEKKE